VSFAGPESDSPLPGFGGFKRPVIKHRLQMLLQQGSAALTNAVTRIHGSGAATIPPPLPLRQFVLAPIWRRAVSMAMRFRAGAPPAAATLVSRSPCRSSVLESASPCAQNPPPENRRRWGDSAVSACGDAEQGNGQSLELFRAFRIRWPAT